MAAAIPLVIWAVSTAVQVKGQLAQGKAAKKAGDAALDIGRDVQDLENYNASVAELQAEDAIARGHDEEGRFRAGVRGLIGSQRAGFAGQNVDVGVGSAVDVQADAAFLGELDALTIRNNAAREALGYHVEAENATRRGQIALKQGQYGQQAGYAQASGAKWAAAGTILGAATTASSLLYQRYGKK